MKKESQFVVIFNKICFAIFLFFSIAEIHSENPLESRLGGSSSLVGKFG